DREVHVAGRPAEAERRRAHTDADGAVGAVRAAVRVRAGDERARRDETLLREIEVEDAVARRRVVRPAHAVEVRELLADRGPLVGPGDARCGAHGARELAPTDRDDPARAADLLLLRRERRWRVGLAARLVGERPRRGVEAERVALLRVFDGRAALEHVQA